MDRSEYFLKLIDTPLVEVLLNKTMFQIRTVQPTDASSLAELMIDAYRGTIDYDGETYDDALGEVKAFMAGERGGPPWLDVSYLATVDSHVVGACLTSEWRARQLPIIAYAMTSADWNNHGIGRHLLYQVLIDLKEKGYPEVRAVITDGNTSSENLFLKIGFQKFTTV